MFPGITQSVVGYTGGENRNPTYQTVCAGDGHYEALQLEYDEDQLSYEDLVDAFFSMHAVNTMGKKQYRSAILYHDEEQKETAEKVLKSKRVPKDLDVLEPASHWHDAEEYHQKYAVKQLEIFYGD